MTSRSDPRSRVLRWLEDAVIGLDLCPFAAAPHRRGLVRISVTDAGAPDEVVEAALDEARRLLETPPSELATTLVVIVDALAELDAFLDTAAALEAVLEEAGAAGILQVATFHPDYRFEGVPTDDLGNWTNRAPLPVLHLIREDDVADAVARHPDPQGIPARNVARLQGLGPDALTELWARWGGA